MQRMNFYTISVVVMFLFSTSLQAATNVQEHFYCGFTNTDGTHQNYARWGKGTDYIYVKKNKRWEMVSEYTYQYIYLDGKYEQITRSPLFDDQIGSCNAKMEKKYKMEIEKIKKLYN